MEKVKLLGHHGFIIYFLHSFWFIVKFDVLEVVEESRLCRGVLSTLSSSFINLVPKEEGARCLENFHPISLCNVIYKIITKIITN